VGLGSGITGRRVAGFCLAAFVYLLASSAIASAELAASSTETLALSAPYERTVGSQMLITAEGTADGRHRLFVYGEAEGTCAPWPDEEPNQKAAVWLSKPEGELLGAGPFSKTYRVTPAKTPSYDVCAYLDTTPSELPDAFEWACWWIPNGNCYMSNVTARDLLGAREEAGTIYAEAEAERTRREEAEQAQRHTNEEAAARQASEEAERRRAIEAAEHRARDITLTRCTVPRLHRHTLAGAHHLLRDASCRLGRVTFPHHAHGTLVVVAQSPQHGKTLPHDSAVSIVLGPRAG